jgi:flagellar biosynthesis protein
MSDHPKTTTSSPDASDAPQTVAIALEEREGLTSPVITASGRGYVAEQILAIAFANDIKVRSDADLVQVLSAIDVENEIPTEAVAAVSEILAYVYKANGKAAPSAHSTAPPDTSRENGS